MQKQSDHQEKRRGAKLTFLLCEIELTFGYKHTPFSLIHDFQWNTHTLSDVIGHPDSEPELKL